MKKTKKVLRLAALGIVLTATGCIQDSAVKREPGNWRLDRKLVTFEMPHMSPEERDRTANMMSNIPSEARCLSQEQVNKDGPLADLLSRTAGGSVECTWSKMSVADGGVDVAGACAVLGQTFDMTVVGTAQANKTDIIVTMNGKIPAGKVVLSMTDVRTGPCAADTVGGS